MDRETLHGIIEETNQERLEEQRLTEQLAHQADACEAVYRSAKSEVDYFFRVTPSLDSGSESRVVVLEKDAEMVGEGKGDVVMVINDYQNGTDKESVNFYFRFVPYGEYSRQIELGREVFNDRFNIDRSEPPNVTNSRVRKRDVNPRNDWEQKRVQRASEVLSERVPVLEENLRWAIEAASNPQLNPELARAVNEAYGNRSPISIDLSRLPQDIATEV